MDNRLREIEQWVAEARDGLGDGGREAYVRKLYLLDAEIRAVIKDSGILPQADSPRPATSLVRHLSSLALPVASAVVVLAVATVYLRGGILKHDSSILTARTYSSKKNTPPAGPSSPSNWQDYLAEHGETIVEFASVAAPVEIRKPEQERSVVEHPAVVMASSRTVTKPSLQANHPVAKPVETPAKPPVFVAAAKKPVPVDANESTSVAASTVIMASYTPPARAEAASADPKPALKKVKNTKTVKPVDSGDELPIDTDKIIAAVNEKLDKR
jgi:hypothetical protein